MTFKKHLMFTLLGMAALGSGPITAQEPQPAAQALRLSPQLLELLRSEMRALVTGIQTIPAAIATADWKHIATTSAQISASYILNQKLTPAQKTELQDALPDHFKRLDANFHREARKLEAAAHNHDAQLAAFHYYRLLETCTTCHSTYASSRFPDFAADAVGAHGH